MSALAGAALSKRIPSKIVIASAALVAIAAVTSSHPTAQRDAIRRGGPRDWSHGRVIASDFGPDGGRNIGRDWRTRSKHIRLEQARLLQNRSNVDWPDLLDRLRGGRMPAPESNAGPHLDWNLKTGGYGNVVGAPAKYSFDITASNCSDVIYFTVDQNGAAATPNVIAITNAYAGCSGNAAGTTPTVKWAIRMTSGTATSAVPSLDGTVLYVLESRPTGVILHAINVNNITTNRGTYNFTTQVWSNAHVLATSPIGTAVSEQLFQITFSGVIDDVASPYLDYENNQIFFGDSTGHIQHVINTHLSSATKDATHFTKACGAAQLQSPVFVNDQVIVTSYDGFLYRLDTTGASPYACIAAAQGGAGTSVGIAGALSAPIVDVTNNSIIVSSNNAAGFSLAGIGTFDLMFTAGAAPTSIQLLGPATTLAPSTGSFDDQFWSTNNGNFYAVAASSGSNNTYLVRFAYHGHIRAGIGLRSAAPQRSGCGSRVEPGHRVSDRKLTRQQGLRVHGRRRRHVPVHESHRRRVRWNRRNAKEHGQLVRHSRRRDLPDHHRHEHERGDRIDGDGQHLLRHDGRGHHDAEHDRPVGAAVLVGV